MVVAELLIAGDQIPAMPLLDVAERLKLPPAQIGGTCVKVGVWVGFTGTVIVVETAQGGAAALGVKV